MLPYSLIIFKYVASAFPSHGSRRRGFEFAALAAPAVGAAIIRTGGPVGRPIDSRQIGPWSVRDDFQSAALRDAVDGLGTVLGLKIERHTGYDV